jgi:glucose-1-phosphate adenylyltransferase
MDYSKMLDFHKENNAEATISVINVPYEEASRYGIMNCHENGKIYEFEEKPKNPKSTLASMGVYIFNWSLLREYLVKDSESPESDNDFGKNIIPAMLNDGKSMWAYQFSGYWRDVGTIQAFWESNMDLVSRVPEFNLYDYDWKIYTPNPVKSAHYIGPTACVKKSMIAEGCTVYGTVINSILFPGAIVEEGAVVEDSIVMSNSKVCKNAKLQRCIISEWATVGENSVLGEGEDIENEYKPNIYNSGITVVGESASIPAGTKIGKNVMIDIGASEKDFTSLIIDSGKSVFKGGDAE